MNHPLGRVKSFRAVAAPATRHTDVAWLEDILLCHLSETSQSQFEEPLFFPYAKADFENVHVQTLRTFLG